MVALATALQHVIRDQDLTNTPDSEKKGIAFAFAGLPSVSTTLQETMSSRFKAKPASHSQRDPRLKCEMRMQVSPRSLKEIPEEIALDAARKAGGHPYMIRSSGITCGVPPSRRLDARYRAATFQLGNPTPFSRLYEAICAPLYYGLRSPQRFFIEAMAKDGDAPSKVSDIAERTGRTTSWAAKYRASLIREHIIESAGYGLVRPHRTWRLSTLLWPEE